MLKIIRHCGQCGCGHDMLHTLLDDPCLYHDTAEYRTCIMWAALIIHNRLAYPFLLFVIWEQAWCFPHFFFMLRWWNTGLIMECLYMFLMTDELPWMLLDCIMYKTLKKTHSSWYRSWHDLQPSTNTGPSLSSPFLLLALPVRGNLKSHSGIQMLPSSGIKTVRSSP